MISYFQVPTVFQSVLLLSSVLLAANYCVFWLGKSQSTLKSAAKIAPMATLVLIALAMPLPIIIIAALVACTIGDWMLSLEGERNFLLGLGAFLAGHLFYILYFLPQIDPAMIISGDALMLALLLIALIAMILLRLWPFLHEMKLPVVVYALIIAAMAFVARLAMPGFFVLAGIALFMISDIILAHDKFTPLSNSPIRTAMPILVMVLYYVGQILIVYGLMTHV